MPGMGGPSGPGGADVEEAPRRRGVLLPTIIVLALLVGAFVIFSGYYTDWLWFDSVDKTQVFTTSIATRAVLICSLASRTLASASLTRLLIAAT